MRDSRKQQLERDLCRIMSDEAGRRVLRWVIYDMGGLTQALDPASVRLPEFSTHAVYAEGRRALAVRIYRTLDCVPLADRQKMIQEAILEAAMEETR